MKISSNYYVPNFRMKEIPQEDNKVTVPNFKSNFVKLAALPAGTLAAITGVKSAFCANDEVNSAGNGTESKVPATKYGHQLRALKAKEALVAAGFGEEDGIFEVYRHKLDTLSEITGEHFYPIINDLIQMHSEVKNGQEVTADFVRNKINGIKEKYNLPENARDLKGVSWRPVSYIYRVLEDWKYYPDFCLARGDKKADIGRYQMRKRTEPNYELMQKFDDIMTRVGDEIAPRKIYGVFEDRFYQNKFGQKIVVHIDTVEHKVREIAYLNENNNDEHFITKNYTLPRIKDTKNRATFDEAAERYNGAKVGRFEILEFTKIGNVYESIQYDAWGIKKEESHREKNDYYEKETVIRYAGDGSLLSEKSEKNYLK